MVVGVQKHPCFLQHDQTDDNWASSIQRILQKFKTKLLFYPTFTTATGRPHEVQREKQIKATTKKATEPLRSLPPCEIWFFSIVITTVFFCLHGLCRFLSPLPQPLRLQRWSWAQHSPRECKKRRKSMEKILLRAHTFLSRFERVSFNFSLISICCFWESLAAHLTRRNKLSPGFSYKRPFQLRPLVCLCVPVSVTPWGILNLGPI